MVDEKYIAAAERIAALESEVATLRDGLARLRADLQEALPDRYVNAADAMRELGYGRTAIYGLRKDPDFPKPVQVLEGGDPRYSLRAVLAYAARRAEKQGKAEPVEEGEAPPQAIVDAVRRARAS